MARRQANMGKKEAAALNRVKAMRLRLRGKSCPAIAEELGVNARSAHRYIQTALAQLGALQERDAQRLRDLEQARLDALTEALWPHLSSENPRVVVAAVSAAVRLIEQRMRLLGLNAPEQHDLRIMGSLAMQAELKDLRNKTTEELLELNRAYLGEAQ